MRHLRRACCFFGKISPTQAAQIGKFWPEAIKRNMVLSTTVSTTGEFALFRDGDLIDTSLTSEEFLLRYPRGAYSSARTVSRSAIFNLDFHVKRLSSSAKILASKEGIPEKQIPPTAVEENVLRSLILKRLKASVQSFLARYEYEEGELKITLLSTGWVDGNHVLYTHIAPMKNFGTDPVDVQILGRPRENALAKDSRWVTERTQFTSKKLPNVNEIILKGEQGDLVEGSETNFFTVEDGKIITAQEGILLGTVRDIVITVCKKLSIPVVYKAPNIATINHWQEAMISSTSRLVLPIRNIYTEDPEVFVKMPSTELSRKIAEEVQREVVCQSTSFL